MNALKTIKIPISHFVKDGLMKKQSTVQRKSQPENADDRKIDRSTIKSQTLQKSLEWPHSLNSNPTAILVPFLNSESHVVSKFG